MGQTLGGLCPNCVGAWALGADPGEGSVAAPVPLVEKPGDRIGRYQLLQKIGEGGCGLVYMAQQEEPVRRQVALKIIKLGMDTKNVIARFEAERQALALMDHPNVAKVLDAGATDTGRPFFVMELVRGIRITQYCDENQLTTLQRLDLFVQVCQAIQHAHQKGLIHRDIKPSNILVTLRDGVPVPKVIDFGIAKATTDQLLTDKTIFTEFQQFVGTPAYMSPEQAEMSELGVDTRSDIYSLGILLYELLTGKTPFETKRLIGAGLDEIRRIIREEEPPRPSTRLDTLDKAEQTTVAKARQSEPPKLVGLIRGDLDWIVMKALEKDRRRRYETANGLAADIQRYLSNEPVVARPPSKLYRFQKVVRRNKLAFGAAAAIAAALLIGLAASTLLFFKEKEARQRAETQATRSQQVVNLLKRTLQSVGPSKALGRDTTMMKEILDQTARTMGKDLTNQPEVEVEMSLILATTYHDLGSYKDMEEIARHSLQLARAKFGQQDLRVADSLQDIGDALHHLNSPIDPSQAEALAEAEKCSRESLAIIRKLLPSLSLREAGSLAHLANVLSRENKVDEAESTQREALAIYQKVSGTNEPPGISKLLFDLANTLSLRASRVPEAEALVRRALAMQKSTFTENHPEVAKSLQTLCHLLCCEDKLTEAESNAQQALAIWSRLKTGDRLEVAGCLRNLVVILLRQGRLPEAEARLGEAIAMMKRLSGNKDPEVFGLVTDMEDFLVRQGKWDKAEAVEHEVLEAALNQYGTNHFMVAGSLQRLGNFLQRQGKLAEAETISREALAISTNLPDAQIDVTPLEQLASVLEEQGKLEEALAGRLEALTILKTNHWDRPNSAISLAGVLAKLTFKLNQEGRFAEAEALNHQCLEELQDKNSLNTWWVCGIKSDLGVSLLAQGKLAEAEPLLLSGYEGLKRCEYRIPTNAVTRLAEAAGRLAQFYEISDQAEKAAQWRSAQALAQAAEPSAKEAAARRASGLDNAQRRCFGQATADFARVLELRPGDHEVWNWQAAVLVRTDQIEAYRELRRKAVRLFEHTPDAITSGRISFNYFILPSNEPALETAAKMAEAAMNSSTNHSDMVSFRLASGLAEYRLGHFNGAIDLMQQVIAESGADFMWDAQALLVLAMAQQQLKHTGDASATLAKGLQIVDTRMCALECDYLGDDWVDWVIAHALMREAKTLVEGSEDATTTSR